MKMMMKLLKTTRRKVDQAVKEEGRNKENEQDVGKEFHLQVVAALGEAQENIRNIVNKEDVATDTSLHI